MPEITLYARNLTRRFGNQRIVHDLTLELKRGEVLGLLGHNGAGKSTTLQMLTGCLLPDSGEIEICGINLRQNPVSAKAHIGYLPETPPLYKELSVNDYLIFAARLRGMKQTEVDAALTQTVQRCGLESVRLKIISTLSKGYQQRVGIAQAIIHSPAVIVLDEPTVGLDPAQIRDIRYLIRELGNTSSVILSTHLLHEVESVCDRVEIMQQGRLIYSDSSLRMQHYDEVSGFVISLKNPPPLSVLQAIPGVSSAEQMSPNDFRILHTAEDNPGSRLLAEAAQNDWQLAQLTPLHATLEEVFVKITGEKTKGPLS
ncbi:MAG: ABC transporter ATP-binding protein [Gallionellales bacterium RIFOXYB12_FULL_54_9]|nr:MAG: ABC transporter ATP-binding protein [Gallionellales bacterium RIFOXYB12_FULL_54_9]